MRVVCERSRHVASVLMIALLFASCAGGGRDVPPPGDDFGFPPLEEVTRGAALDRTAPRWENLTSAGGAGPTTLDLAVAPGALQWRVLWTCDAGSLRLSATGAQSELLTDHLCPGRGEAFSIQTGPLQLAVEATGPWTATVQQQVDTPISEPPLQEMASSPVVAEGSFYEIDQRGKGTVRLYRLPNGRGALRFEDFWVSTNTDLFVWLSEAERPQTSAEAFTAPHVEIAELKSTAGSQNYLVPADLPLERVRSVVIWCQPIQVAYIAAELER